MWHQGRKTRRSRRGAQLLECALVYPLLFLIIIGMVVLGMGVFRYAQVASLAREGARWASVRGRQYEKDLNPNGQPGLPRAASPQSVRDYVASRAVSLDTSPQALDVRVAWDSDNRQFHSFSDRYGNPLMDSEGRVIRVTNTVTVTVAYKWVPEALFAGPIHLTSTSTMPMAY